MKFNRRHFLGAVAAGSAGLVMPRTHATVRMPEPLVPTVRATEPPNLLARAMSALDVHGASIAHRDVLGIVDFSLSSGEPRFHLVDIANGRIARTWLVAHGRGSDPANSGWVERFSNVPGSNASSRGSFVTSKTYVGKHGRSRKVCGLDPENSLAESRAIVIHGADYVDPGRAEEQGRVGRSQGCFAVSRAEIGDVLERLDEGRLLFAWK